jgi:hypothetical protein
MKKKKVEIAKSFPPKCKKKMESLESSNPEKFHINSTVEKNS